MKVRPAAIATLMVSIWLMCPIFRVYKYKIAAKTQQFILIKIMIKMF